MHAISLFFAKHLQTESMQGEKVFLPGFGLHEYNKAAQKCIHNVLFYDCDEFLAIDK